MMLMGTQKRTGHRDTLEHCGSLCVSGPLTAQPGSQGGLERRSCQPRAGGDTVLQDGALSNKADSVN